MHTNLFPFRQPAVLALLLLLACTQQPAPAHASAAPARDPVVSKPIPPQTPPQTPPPAPAPTPARVARPAPPAPAPSAPEAIPAPVPAPSLHDAWNTLLGKHVSASGKVNYKAFVADRAALDAYLKTLADNTPADDWSRAEKMAYWINAYNAFTIDLIVDNYPLSSILKLDGGKTWDVKRITLGNKKYSLNQIENDILRPQFKDARIHFAINCAAKSCPPLLNKAYTAENLERTLEQRTRQFVNDAKFNTLTEEKAAVSKIFEWYGVDFGDLKTFLNKYSGTKLGAAAVVTFQEYNWDLNE